MRRRLASVCIGVVIMLGSQRSSGAGEVRPTAAAHPTPPPMSQEAMHAFLARPLVARFATVRKNGTPQVVPMWFLWDNGTLYMSTRTWAAKVKHLRKNPHVAVVIDEMVAPMQNRVVGIDGTATIVTDGVREMSTRIYQKYMGAEAAKSQQAQQSITTPRVLIKITPTKIWSMDTTKK